MVIKSKIYEFLKKNLGEYLYGFEKNQLDVGLLSGRIELVNVNFRPDKVNEFLATQGLPIHIKAGLIGKLKFKCNYISFLTSPVEVELDELLLVFGPISHMYKEKKLNEEFDSDIILWQLNKENEILNYGKKQPNALKFAEYQSASESEHQKHEKTSRRKNQTEKNTESEVEVKKTKRKHRSKVVHSADDEALDPSHLQVNGFSFEERQKVNKMSIQEESFTKPPKKKSFLEKYFTKVLRNLTLTVKSVHIIYEDESYPYENPLSMGLSIEKLEVKNISQEWTVTSGKQTKAQNKNKTLIKEILLSNLSIFIYSMASVIIPISLCEETINSPIGIFEAFPAYEVRDMIIQQCKMLSTDHPSTFLYPMTAKACVTFSEEFPNIRAVGLIDSVFCKFTPAMAECLRNFYDYCTNVQIWPLVLRHRPIERIPERPAKRERRKQRKIRKEIVKKWFLYAFQFVKLKIAALKYVKGRRREREIVKKREEQGRIKEKAFQRKIFRPKVEKKEVAKENSTFSSIFSLGRNKEQSSGTCSGIIGGINGKKPPVVQKQIKRPYDGDQYFNKSLCNTEIELHVNLLKVSITNEDTNNTITAVFSNIFKCTTTLLDEMTSVLSVQEFCISYQEKKKSLELFKCSGKLSNKNSTADYGFKGKIVYRPAEVYVPNDVYITYNMFEYTAEIGTVTAKYSNKLMNQLFLMKECISIDKVFRENADQEFVKRFGKRKLDVGKRKSVKGAKIISKVLESGEKWIEKKVAEMNSTFLEVLFCAEVVLNGGEVGFEDSLPGVVMSFGVPKGKVMVGKDKEKAFLEVFGVKVSSNSTPSGMYDFCRTLKSLGCEKMKRIKRMLSFKI